MNTKDIQPGVTVLVEPTCGKGLLADAKYMVNRKGVRAGVILRGFSPVDVPVGHGAAWVRHDDDGTTAPYWFHEMTETPA